MASPATKRSKGEIPLGDEAGFYGIRLESIGGLGAHLAGQILAEAGVLYQGLNGAHFSSYGSEKKGSPVKSYVRFCAPQREVRTSSPVDRPHLVAIFHEALLKTERVTEGLRPEGIAILNTNRSPQEAAPLLGSAARRVGVVDALRIAVAEGSRVNTAMLGAVTRASGFLEPQAVRKAIEATFSRKYPHLVEANLRTFQRGYDELEIATVGESAAPPTLVAQAEEPSLGYRNAPIGGLLVSSGNSILKDLSASRQGYLPAFYAERCVHCGICDLVCPDFCFLWRREANPTAARAVTLLGIDYRYCKGCMKCVVSCPTEALVQEREEEGYAAAHTVPLLVGLVDSSPAGSPS